MINIVNGTNVRVTGKIYAPAVNVFAKGIQYNFKENTKIPKTMTIVYGHNSTRTRNRKIVLGHRQPGDRELDSETKNVTITYRFPEFEFQYQNPSHSLTAVEFSFDVRRNEL